MDALTDILSMSPVPVKNVSLSSDCRGYVVMSCVIEEVEGGLTHVQSKAVEAMLNQLIDVACTVLSTDRLYERISLELSYSSYDEWLDAIGTIISIERTRDGKQLKIERYDPMIMDTVITFRDCYEADIMQCMQSVKING